MNPEIGRLSPRERTQQCFDGLMRVLDEWQQDYAYEYLYSCIYTAGTKMLAVAEAAAKIATVLKIEDNLKRN